MSTRSQHRRSSAYSLFPPRASNTNASSNTVSVIPIWYDPSSDLDGKTEDILGKSELDAPEQCFFIPTGEDIEEAKEGKRFKDYCPILRAINRMKRQSANMKQLIPLKLTAMSAPFSRTPTPTRNISDPSPLHAPERPIVPARSPSVTRRSRPGPVATLNILPYTREEWKKIMGEVKFLYKKGAYKHCSMRCKQVLSGIKDPYRVHPLYSTYLSFFAASSLEITASYLHHNSSAKLPLYREALAYYQKAEDGLEYASFSTDLSVIPTSSLYTHASNASLSSTSSIFSSADSVFSHRSSSSCSLNSVAFTSPQSSEDSNSPNNAQPTARRNSLLSTHSLPDSLKSSQSSLRHKKKVTFAFSPTLPTLVSENDIPDTAIDASTLIDSFPTPPCSPTPPDSPTLPTAPNLPQVRYKAHLLDLSQQLAYHMTALHESIATVSAARAPRRSGSPDFSASLLFSGLERPSSAPGLRPGSRSGLDVVNEDEIARPDSRLSLRSPGSRMGLHALDEEEMMDEEQQIADIQARIARLRASGWQRKRFDPTRYRELCERALYEVVEGEYF